MFVYDHKVPGGKLVRIKMRVHDDRVTFIQILGDFFLHPEEAITALENAIVGKELSEPILLAAIESALQSETARLIGADSNDLVKAILLASGKPAR